MTNDCYRNHNYVGIHYTLYLYSYSVTLTIIFIVSYLQKRSFIISWARESVQFGNEGVCCLKKLSSISLESPIKVDNNNFNVFYQPHIQLYNIYYTYCIYLFSHCGSRLVNEDRINLIREIRYDFMSHFLFIKSIRVNAFLIFVNFIRWRTECPD